MSKIVRLLKNVANGYSSTQVLVRNATSNDTSGPTTYDMEMVAAATYNSQTEFLEVMDMLDRRLNDKGRNWRHVAKSLTVLDYLVRFGSEKCVLWLKDNLYIIKTLREFVHFDESNTDQGALIRVKAKELVALLRDDERLTTERNLARRSRSDRNNQPDRSDRGDRNGQRTRRGSDPYDSDLQRALEMSRESAAREQQSRPLDPDAADPDLQAALKLSLEEEEMRRRAQQAPPAQNANLLDLDDAPPQQQQYTQFYQPVYAQPTQFFQPQQTFQQYDMFGNPVQQTAGYYQTPDFGQFGQPQIPQYTGFAPAAPQSQPQDEQLTPLKTGSNNPFAMSDGGHQSEQRPQQLQSAPQFFTQPTVSQFQPQEQAQPQTSPQPQQRPQMQKQPSRYNETHELNNLLASGTGLDTFGNTGASRIPHQHTKTGTFINSSGTGFNNAISEHRVSSNATGNPFLNTGIGHSATPTNSAPNSRINPAHTGYGFGNSKDEPSLIDI